MSTLYALKIDDYRHNRSSHSTRRKHQSDPRDGVKRKCVVVSPLLYSLSAWWRSWQAPPSFVLRWVHRCRVCHHDLRVFEPSQRWFEVVNESPSESGYSSISSHAFEVMKYRCVPSVIKEKRTGMCAFLLVRRCKKAFALLFVSSDLQFCTRKFFLLSASWRVRKERECCKEWHGIDTQSCLTSAHTHEAVVVLETFKSEVSRRRQTLLDSHMFKAIDDQSIEVLDLHMRCSCALTPFDLYKTNLERIDSTSFFPFFV